MSNDAIAMALMQAGQMVPRTVRDPYAERKKAALASILAGSSTEPVKGGVGEGIARMLTAGVGGYFLNKANQDQEREDTGRRDALVGALTPGMGPDGKPAALDPAAVARAVGRIPGYEGMAAMLGLGVMSDDRNRVQAGGRADDITGGRPPMPSGGPASGSGAPPGSYPDRASGTESPNGATNPQTGAIGFFQFMPRTAIGLAKQTDWGASLTPDQIVTALKTDPAKQRDLMQRYTAISDATLTQAGMPVNDVNRFALHAFGPSGGMALLRAPDNMPMAQWVRSVNWGEATPDQVVAQNGLAKYQTVGQLKQDFIARRIGGGGQPPVAPQGAPQAPPAAALPPQAPTAAPPVPSQAAPVGALPPPPPPTWAPPGSVAPPIPGQQTSQAGPPIEGAGLPPDDSGQDRGGRGGNPGFATPLPAPVVTPPPFAVDDGKEDLAIAQRRFARGDPASIEDGIKFWQAGQAKAQAAQQRAYDLQFKPPERVTLPGGAQAPVIGSPADPAVIERDQRAKTQGAGVQSPPQLVGGTVATVNDVTRKIDPLPVGDKLREADQAAREALTVTGRFLDVFKSSDFATSLRAYINDPRSPEAQTLNQAFENLRIIVRSPALVNTGVLQPHEVKIIDDMLLSPHSIRGLLASPEAMRAKLEELQRLISTRRDAAFASAGVTPPDMGAPGGGQSSAGAPLPNHVEYLRANPDTAAAFDGKYGPGSAAKVLGAR